jgi:ABC-type branched-subunit amino acid transport system substrate-binding protein
VRRTGVSESEVVFGLVAPFSGPAAGVGQQMKTGVEAAFAAANAAGGVAGRKLRLEVRDDGFEPARTLGALRELDETANVLGVLGHAGTANAVFAIPFAADRQMLFFGSPSGSPMLRHVPPERYAFNVRASTTDEILAVARYLTEVRHLPSRQIAVVSLPSVRESSDAALLGELRLSPVLARSPFFHVRPDRPTGAVVEEAATTSLENSEETAAAVRDAVLRLTTHIPPIKAALLVAPAAAAAHIVALAKPKRRALIFAVTSPAGPTTAAEELRRLPPRLAKGTLVTHVVPPPDGPSAAAIDYRAALAQSIPGEPARELSFEAYLTAQILIHGLTRAGRALDSERLVEGLEGLRGSEPGLDVDLGFSRQNHQAWHRVWLTEVGADGGATPLPLVEDPVAVSDGIGPGEPSARNGREPQ